MTSSSPPGSAQVYGTDPTSRLILLPNTDPVQDYYSDDDDDDSDSPSLHPPADQPPLCSSVVFLYLLSPYLRLGAIYASDFGATSLTYRFITLTVAAILSAFCRQIWFLLGRYLRKSSTEDILIYAFVRRHRRIRKYRFARYTFTVVSTLFKMLLAAMYLRDSVDAALLLKIPKPSYLPSRFNMSIMLSIVVFVLSLPKSLASKSVVYTTGLSVASYLAWLAVVSRSNERWLPSPSLFRQGVLWNEISSYAFACTTTMTVPLSTSLMAGVPMASTNTRMRSFEALNAFSTALAVLLMFPLVFIGASLRTPASITPSDNLILCLRMATLVLSIPSIVVSIIPLPSYVSSLHRFIRADLALSVIVAAIFALSLVPPTTSNVLDDVTMVFAVIGTFLLPALVHITIHYFRSPLSIVVPQEPSSVPSTPRTSDPERSPSPSRDPLLQRKERLLQRSRFGRRLFWDIVVWIILIPVCSCAFVWTAGRLARQW